MHSKLSIKTLTCLCTALLIHTSTLAASPAKDRKPILSWGDQGNGTFANPVMNADYSDPDIIRVGKKYYMTCSEFHYMGMPILESDDMVNWRIIGQIYKDLPLEKFNHMDGYGDGTWAPALRYHDGKFWMFVCMPETGLYMSTATDPAGPWEPLYHVKDVKGWEDPCPFWDEDGQAYLGRSILGAGPIILHRMSPDGKQLLDEGKEIYRGEVAEGTKFLKKDGYYYLSIPEGGVTTGWQTVLRSKNIYGPYERKVCLEKGSTEINGPHQGSLVDTPEGEWWFYHFQSHEPQGRVVHLQPVTWKDGFPVIGQDIDGNGIGEPMRIVKKPSTGVKRKPSLPQTSDKFKSRTLGLQWQSNHNMEADSWSLTARRGWLTLYARKADYIYKAHNQLAQKMMGNRCAATVKLDISAMEVGQRAGLGCIGNPVLAAGVWRTTEGLVFYYENEGHITLGERIPEKQKTVWVRLDMDGEQNDVHFLSSLDKKEFAPLGEHTKEFNTGWKGVHVSLFTYNKEKDGGVAQFDDFDYSITR